MLTSVSVFCGSCLLFSTGTEEKAFFKSFRGNCQLCCLPWPFTVIRGDHLFEGDWRYNYETKGWSEWQYTDIATVTHNFWIVNHLWSFSVLFLLVSHRTCVGKWCVYWRVTVVFIFLIWAGLMWKFGLYRNAGQSELFVKVPTTFEKHLQANVVYYN
jgi:hypothetical protein